MQSQGKTRDCERGSSILEFVLVIILFLLLIIGSVYASVICVGYCNITYASRLAVRYAVMHGMGSTTPCSQTDLQNMIAPNLWFVPNPVIAISWNPDNDSNSGVVTITISSNLPGIPLTSIRSVPVSVTNSGSILQ